MKSDTLIWILLFFPNFYRIWPNLEKFQKLYCTFIPYWCKISTRRSYYMRMVIAILHFFKQEKGSSLRKIKYDFLMILFDA